MSIEWVALVHSLGICPFGSSGILNVSYHKKPLVIGFSRNKHFLKVK